MKNKNVLLVESHYRSRSWFLALFKTCNLYVISVNRREKHLFLKQGVKRENILDLHNLSVDGVTLDTATYHVSEFEKKYNFCLNALMRRDLNLRRKDHEYRIRYACVCIQKLQDFLIKNSIHIVFLEPTWLHEVLTCILCKKLGIRVWAPTKCKILPNRFFFFEGWENKNYFLRSKDEVLSNITHQIREVFNKNEKPQYFDVMSKRNRLNFNKFVVLFEICRSSLLGYANKNIHPSVYHAVVRKLRAIFYEKILLFTGYFSSTDKILSSYVLINLHVQPEASVDVVGGTYSNQLSAIQAIARTVPAEYLIVVKEHPHGVGDRPLNFYTELKRIPGVICVHPGIDNRELIQKATLVVSNVGTSSLEAALLGVPSVTMTEMYFHEALLRDRFDPYAESVGELICQYKNGILKVDVEKNFKIISDIKLNSFEGNCGDGRFDKSVMQQGNIALLREAFSEVINENVDA